ncbi:hypothetical protein IAG44_24815 [Streptomyces roseirectus]|uniref:Uncharacterized protein n=1 Tax=Streptomyces roseirectus TaxID=2768066 RepID=A0A7H0IHQ8_9ACTN|nr:hypothetical protein [Streptomyces roseirectus]QNP72324.1 hypothetical protein IAG44_24815 [Streptomyces roseirectus]
MGARRGVRVLWAAVVLALAGVTGIAGTGRAEAAERWELWRNVGNNLCMTSADDPANAFVGTATFAPCDAGDTRQWWYWDLLSTGDVMIVNHATRQCLADVAGWGLAWLGTCDRADRDQIWDSSINGNGEWHYGSVDDQRALSTPYVAGTSYVTARGDFRYGDIRCWWRHLPV